MDTQHCPPVPLHFLSHTPCWADCFTPSPQISTPSLPSSSLQIVSYFTKKIKVTRGIITKFSPAYLQMFPNILLPSCYHGWAIHAPRSGLCTQAVLTSHLFKGMEIFLSLSLSLCWLFHSLQYHSCHHFSSGFSNNIPHSNKLLWSQRIKEPLLYL